MDPRRCGALSNSGLWIPMRLVGHMGRMSDPVRAIGLTVPLVCSGERLVPGETLICFTVPHLLAPRF